MGLVTEILFAVALILTGATFAISGSKPVGWVILALSVIALFFVVLGGFPVAHRG